jgi:glycosyltransferase involved in cell wall biosynthesis
VKIVHVTAGTGYGGTWAQFERLTLALHAAGIGQRVFGSLQSPHVTRVQAGGVETLAMDLPGTFAFMDRRKINAELKRYTPDIVMSWSPAASALIEPGGYVHVGRAPLSFDAARLATCGKLLAPSQTRADAATAAGRLVSDVHVLPNLPLAAVQNGAVAPFDRKKVFTPATARLIFTAARLEESKGIADVFAAVAKLSGIYLWIAGEGAHRAALEERAYTLGIKPRVRFLGWQDDLRPYFAAADVFVYPARQEDLGDVVVEAWAAGAPIVAADSLGPGLLIRHQETGMLVPVGDAQGLADAVKFLLVEKATAKNIVGAGRAAFEATFSPDKLVKQYIDWFQSWIARPAAVAPQT